MKRGAGRLAPALLALLAGLPALAARAQAPAGGGHAYTLSVRLDPEAHRIEGSARIRFRNHGSQPLTALLLHLYPNVFASRKTVFMREGGASIRGGRLERTGGIDLQALSLADGRDLLATAEPELVPGDRTQLRVALPAPLAPGASLELLARFAVRLPSLLARMGSAGDFFMVAQFFPKLAKLEPDGAFAGFPYHGLGEFYADFADYDLRVDVPERYVVAAPGQRVEARSLPEGRRLERYVLPHALDIAFAAAPHLRSVRDERGPVRIEAYAPAGQLRLLARQVALLRDGLSRLSARLGPYPQRRLVLVLPPPAAVGAAGMEYPGLVTGWTAGPFASWSPAAAAFHDVVTAHELAHQWFPMLVATHEAQSPVLDEGLAEWIGLDLVRERVAHGFARRWLGLPLDPFDFGRVAFASAGRVPSSLLPAYEYKPPQLAAAVYLRPALAFETLARTWGRERLWSVLGRYARAHRFGHPRQDDLLRAFDAGYYRGFAAQVLRPALEGAPFATHLAREQAALRARRDAAAGALPSAIEVDYAGGGVLRERWPAGARERRVTVDRGRRALGASVDPDHRNLLDPRRADDQLRLSDAAPRPPLVARLLIAAQALLGVLGP